MPTWTLWACLLLQTCVLIDTTKDILILKYQTVRNVVQVLDMYGQRNKPCIWCKILRFCGDEDSSHGLLGWDVVGYQHFGGPSCPPSSGWSGASKWKQMLDRECKRGQRPVWANKKQGRLVPITGATKRDQGRSIWVRPLGENKRKKHKCGRGPTRGQCRGRSTQERVNRLSLERTIFLPSLKKRHPWPAHGETFFPVHAVRIELNLCHLLNDMFHTSGFLSQEIGIMKLDVVTQFLLCWATADFSWWFLWLPPWWSHSHASSLIPLTGCNNGHHSPTLFIGSDKSLPLLVLCPIYTSTS